MTLPDPHRDADRPEVDIMVGYAVGALQPLRELPTPPRIVLLEHPDVIAKRELERAVAEDPLIDTLIPVRYEDAAVVEAALETFRRWRVRSVMPVNDYATVFAASLAEHLGLPTATAAAARVMREKHLLRETAGAAGVRVAGWRRADTFDEAAAAAAELGWPVIVKPTDRQASVGTIVVPSAEHLDAAWAYSARRDEGRFARDWDEPQRTLVEEYIDGPEYSVECLVVDHEIVFANITAKTLFPGPVPVEQGHRIPAALADDDAALLRRVTSHALQACGFATGITHVEWKLRHGEPVLIEAAGRFAGDGIIEAIATAYDVNLVDAYRHIMRGGHPPELPQQASRVVAIGFLAGAEGVVTRARLPESLLERADVVSAHLMVGEGQRTRPLSSSWDRWASVAVAAETHDAAEHAVATATAQIDIQITEEAAR